MVTNPSDPPAAVSEQIQQNIGKTNDTCRQWHFRRPK